MPDITIAGATFRNVPQIDVPKDGGGSASFIYEEGTKQINTNGTHDVSGYLNAQVSVPSQSPVINPLSVTENGTYTAPSGVDGYSPVTVNVSGGGGLTIDDVAMRTYGSEIYGASATEIKSYAFMSDTQITAAEFPRAEIIGTSAFGFCSALRSASFPSAIFVHSNAFSNCSNLETVNVSNATSIGANAFARCVKLEIIDAPKVQAIGQTAFSGCSMLSKVILKDVQNIYTGAFSKCFMLVELRLDEVSAVPSVTNPAIVFSSTPIAGYSASAGRLGSVFVPASLYSAFATSAGWSAFSSRLVSV